MPSARVAMRPRPLALLVLLVLCGAGWLVLARRGAERALEPAPAAAPEPARTSAALAPEASPPRAEIGARPEREALAGAGPGPATAPEPQPEALAASAVRGRVLDAAGEPVGGVRVELLRAPAEGQAGLDRELSRALEQLGATTSDERGRFAFEHEELLPLRLRASRAGCAAVELRGVLASRAPEALYELVLLPEARLRGRVSAAPASPAASGALGEPLADVLVSVFPRDGRGETVRTRTDALGRYELGGLSSLPLVLEAVPPLGRAAPSGWLDLELEPGTTQERDIALAAGVLVRGRVVDALTGAPISGAEVGETWTFERSVRTDDDGRYALAGVGEEYAEVAVRAAGYGGVQRSFWREPHGPVLDWDFELLPARGAQGRLVDARGAPLAGAYVAAVASDFSGPSSQVDWVAGRTAEDGSFALEGLRADLRHALVARLRGHASVVYDFPEDELESARVELGTLVLPEPGALLGRIVDELGAPHGGLAVVLVGTNADRGRLLSGAERDTSAVDLYVAERELRADAHGRFAFADLPAGVHELRVERPTSHQRVLRQVEVLAGATTEVEVLVERGGRIAGRLLAPEGATLPSACYVSAQGDDGSRANVRADADGSFLLGGLTGSSYDLRAYPYPAAEDARPLVQSSLPHVARGSEDVRWVLREGRWTEGVVRDADGAPAVGLQLSVIDGAGEWVHTSASDTEGRFRLRVPLGERCTLRVRAPSRDEEGGAELPGLDPLPAGGEIELRLDWRP